MFGTLITLGLGAYLAGSYMSDGAKTQSKKADAKSKGEVYYYDAKSKMRSVVTDEILIFCAADTRHRGHRTLVGVNSNAVYWDYSEEELKKENAKLKAEGKKFIWKEVPEIHESGKNACSWKSTYWPWDTVNNSFYLIKTDYMRPIGSDRYYKEYQKLEGNWMHNDFEKNKNKDYVSGDEYQAYNHVVNRRRF